MLCQLLSEYPGEGCPNDAAWRVVLRSNREVLICARHFTGLLRVGAFKEYRKLTAIDLMEVK